MPFRIKNSRNWHYDFQIRGRRFHGTCGTDDYEEAKAIEAEQRVLAKSTAAAQAGIFTVAEAIGTYYSDVARHQSSAKTTLSQGKTLMADIDPKTKLPSLTMAMIQRHISIRRAGVANGTVNRAVQMLGRAVRHMGRVHGAQLPALDLPSLESAEPEERVRELSLDEQDRLFAALRADLHPFVTFALMTGARVATIVGLKWSDVDLDAGLITFRLKGGITRRFPVNAEMRAFLSGLPKAATLPHARYVLTYLNGQGKEPRRHRVTASGGIMGDFRAALAMAGIEDFRFHDLRHTFATRLLRQTGNLKLVSRLLGHTKIETTARYAHVVDFDLRAAIDDYRVTGRVPKKIPKSGASD